MKCVQGRGTMSDKPTVSFDDFTKLDLRVGKVTEVKDHPNADKLLVLSVDLGDEQRTLVAGLKPYCSPEELLGKEIIVVANLEPRKVRGVESRGMLLAASHEQEGEQQVTILTTNGEVPPGASIS
ncbi:MAG: methionine--tRNA ligase subunit beta [Phycisphaerae bacterium]